MIALRELQEKDAPLMLEWMQDYDVQKCFKRNMLTASLDDAIYFCRTAMIPIELNGGENLHFAIVDETDEYLGTISLKNIDIVNWTAEYAIAMRKKAHGKGIGFAATGLILKKAFKEIGLHRVYLSVFANNQSAIRLYERAGFKFEGEFRQHIKVGNSYINWKWYGILDSEYDESLFEEGKK